MDLSDLMLAHRFVLSAPAFVCSAAVFKSRGLALKGLSRGPAVGEKARVCKAGLGSGYEFNVFLFLSSKLKFCFSSAIGPRFASPDEPLATSHPIFVHAVRAFAAPIPTTRRPTGEEPWSGSLLQIRIGRIAWARPGAAFLLEDWSDEFVGLEIPDRRIVQAGPESVPGHGRDFRCQEGVYRCERHPAYLGAMLWGLGIQIALCNPVMLVLVSFVLWASLLHISLEDRLISRYGQGCL
ncbi:Probable protein-S-isoprenylcysteine O-methyltransferase (Isoprenylcysteine carboxylmethyltransferase) (Prenylated protein carboxyl methyltransferase) (Prenylcysteine carboxyl methyltransferase) [Durusdinium trenchii]|uniref:Protein-S-isoprenylcysteine O-methyltransferase n=1 Tax=Durusdinium trenchii TaxID=1381693 RepID=A0ABP0K713_9DINO